MRSKAGLADSMAALQRDYARLARSAALGQAAAERAGSRTAALSKQLADAQAELAATRRWAVGGQRQRQAGRGRGRRAARSVAQRRLCQALLAPPWWGIWQ